MTSRPTRRALLAAAAAAPSAAVPAAPAAPGSAAPGSAAPDGAAPDGAATAFAADVRRVVFPRARPQGLERTLGDVVAAEPLRLTQYLRPADMDGASNNREAVNAAVADARASGRSLDLTGTPHLVLNGPPVDIQGVALVGRGVGTMPATRIVTSNPVDTFTAAGNSAGARGLTVEHSGPAGQIFRLHQGISHRIEDCNLAGTHPDNPDPLLSFRGANTDLEGIGFNNFRLRAYSWLCDAVAAGGLININSAVRHCYQGGPGRGGWIGSSDRSTRPEGLSVDDLKSIVTGGPALTVESVLSLMVVTPMLDQVRGAGLLLRPAAPYGIDDVQILGGWIGSSPTTDPDAVGILHDPALGHGMARLRALGTSFRYLERAARFGPKATDLLLDAGCAFTDLRSGIAVEVPPGASLALGRCLFAQGVQPVLFTGAARAGRLANRIRIPFQTRGFAGYVGAPHGLAAPPSHVAVSVEAGTAGMQPPAVMLAQKDEANVVFALTLAGIAAHGTGYLDVALAV
ncbi:hypothetical protein [Methylobacterium crusticola]|nr:hypothetical protein [Methylobacterium crusticola]